MKRGFIFTMDAMIALSVMIMIILTIAFVSFETVLPEKKYEKLNFVADDMMNLLAHLEVYEVQDTSTIEDLIGKGEIAKRDLNKTVLDLIASFWYKGNYTIAENISRDVLEGLTDDFCLNLTLGKETMYSSCSSSPEDVAVSSRIESGYEPGKPGFGYIARAFLTSITNKRDSSYVYFGGYVGEGNISRELILPPYDSISSAYMEFYVGDDFNLYINGNFSGRYSRNLSQSSNMTADKWYLSSSNFSFFQEGKNNVSINFTGRSYIGGGYIKVTYNTTQMAPTEVLGVSNISLPGIYGVINLYDSFYVPGDLSSMRIFLDFETNAPLFMNIGNTTVYQGNTTILRDNSTLFTKLNYSYLSQRTVPIRIGHYSLNDTNTTGYVTDVVLTTSRVDDMNLCDVDSFPPKNITPDCNSTSTDVQNVRLDLAKVLDKNFVEVILNNSGNRVGLVSYKSTVPTDWITDLTNDNDHLESEIDGYGAKPGQRCLCCAIYEAAGILTDPSRNKFIVLMSDGSAASAPVGQCPIGPDTNPGQAAVNEACDAYQNHNIKVYTIGFGENANNTLLQEIAACGGGKWYASTNYTGLEEIYNETAKEIGGLSVVYEFQTVISTNVNSSLYPDSFIELIYTPVIIPQEYGEISLTRDGNRLSDFTGDSVDIPCKEGWYDISQDVKVVDAKMTSYSAEFWTDRLSINSSATGNWNRFYWLGDFGNNYLILGDPYIVQVPIGLIDSGNNSFCMGSGFNVTNATGGSPDSKLVYTMRVKGSVGYGSTFNSSELANDDAIDRLIDEIQDYVNITTDDIEMNTKDVGGIQWLWGPSLLKVIIWNGE